MNRILLFLEFDKVKNVTITSDQRLELFGYIDVTNEIILDDESVKLLNMILSNLIDVFNTSIYYKSNKLHLVDNYDIEKIQAILR